MNLRDQSTKSLVYCSCLGPRSTAIGWINLFSSLESRIPVSFSKFSGIYLFPWAATHRLRTCTIITEPNELVAQIHTRMPVILPEEDHAKWLGEVEDGDLKALLKPYPADQMRVWVISPRVNSPENNDPGVIDPIPANMDDWKLAGP